MRGLLVICLAAQTALAEDLGTSAAPFLTLGAGARAAALGEAAVASGADAEALYWNPAGLALLDRRSAVLSHASALASSRYEYAALALPLGRWGAVASSLQYSWAPKLTETDAAGVELGSFQPYDLAGTLGFGARLGAWSAGASVKYLRSRVIETDATGAVDIGLLSPAWLGERLRLGLSVLNMGGELNYGTRSFDIPLMGKAGAAWRMAPSWLLLLDATFPREGESFAGAGVEYLWVMAPELRLAMRMGFNSRTLGHVSGFTSPSFGFGLSKSRFSLDYAVTPYGSLGLAHQFSLGASW